ncbi:hypothetical protein KPH14_005997 [Odynerus spinipes]|uniref:chitinase n=1 Tax=Odynerus spinipes TaxID=1348599 RepID=A0AAD9RK36_9HYME|nr:hypothetical protein KPH14_005997 [Odynerus spinipes]
MDWEVRAVFLWLILGVLGTIQDGAAEKKVVCYYTNWSIYRPGTAKFSPQNINPYLCTHLIYAFGGFTKDNALKPFDKYQDIEKGGYAKFTGLKTYNKNLKTMLAIGGWNEGSSRFSPMVADPAKRREFVKNSIKFLRQNHFDGLDLDWEYPAFRDGGKPRDKDNYANLVQELREEFERESVKTGRPRLLLSMAMPAGIEYIDKGYDVPRLNEYLDFINLLSYDYHSAYEPAVNHHAPLYPLEEDNEYNYDGELTIDYTISHLIKSGASAAKIILGIPTYGRSYTLFNEDATDLGSPADGPGEEGDATREKGYLAYYEICESLIGSDDWEVVQPNPKAMGPYAFKGNQWVGYDDVDIVRLKAHYVNEKNLGGIMFWSIDNDDFRGKCHNRPYPLIEAAKETLLIEDGKIFYSRSTEHKPKHSITRKKPRGQNTQSNTVTRRKIGSSNRRSTTTSAPVTRKPVSSSKPKYRTVSRPRFSEEEEEEEEDRELDRRSYDPASVEERNENDSRVKNSDKDNRKRLRNRNKARGQSSNSRRRKPSRNEETKENDTDVATEESLGNKLTTPEPPTTPDPGTDFKCEDEGFFSHPRDCKKYFWCLESGPGGLGIVAHQFTCPSGLVFNKAADSCDYPRNVVCPKAKTSQSSPSTTRAPIVAATSRTTYLHSTTQRTTTAKADSEEDYEYYDDEEELDDSEEDEEDKLEPRITSTAKPLQYKTINRSKPTVATTTTTTTTTSEPEKEEEEKSNDQADEEDPKVIKELINLIRKAGGIEELEKQLHFQEKGSGASSDADPVTPATISRTLYERVLSRQAGKIISGSTAGSSENGGYKNGPGRTQFEGLDEIPEVKSLRRTHKPQYVTIERPKPSTNAPAIENEETDDEEELDHYTANAASSEDETISNPSEISTSTQRVTPNYVNIRRNRFSTTTARNENDVEEKNEDVEEETSIRRRRPNGSNKNQDKESEEASKPFRTRTRNRNTEEPPEALNSDINPTQKTRQTDESSTATTKSRYINIQRFRSTTLRPVENPANDNDNSGVVEISTDTSIVKNKVDTEEEITTASTSTISSTVPSTTPFSVPTTTTSPTTFSQSTSSSVSSTLLYLPSSTSTSTEVTVKVDPTEDTSIPNLLGDNVNSVSSTTTDSVKLVEDSATEILLTTAPATSSPPSTSVQTSTRVVATVSQPRPFGFTRRRSGSVTPEVTTTPIAPSSERSRSKVSIASRNSTRSNSYLVGRGRLRPRPDPSTRVTGNKRITEQEQLENPPTSEETFSKPRDATVNRSRPSNKRRGVSRYTLPTASPITEDAPKNSISRRRNRTTEAPSTTTRAVTESASPRRRYRRPSSVQSPSTTESTRANELDDSPIVRITQGYPSRSKKFRSKSEINVEKEEAEKITNIRVFKQPTINKELYGRPRNAIKRNYVDIEQINRRTNEVVENKKETPVYSTVATTTTKEVEQEQSTTVTSLEIANITENDSTNTVDGGFAESSIPTVTEFEESSTTVQSDSETNTIMSTYATETTTDVNTVSTDSIVSYETSESSEELPTTQNILAETTSLAYNNTEVAEVTQNETIDVTDSSERKGYRRVKVFRRRRPVTASTTSNTTSTTTVQPEKNGKPQVIRRRKVLKRVRPVDHKSSTASFETSSQEEEQNVSRSSETTTELQPGESKESENVTESISMFATEFPNSIDYTLTDRSTDSKWETTTETIESTKNDDLDRTTAQVTIIDGAVTEALTLLITESTTSETDDLYSTVITTEPTVTPSTTFVENTFDPAETRVSTENVTAGVQTTTPLTTRNLDESSAYGKSSSSESRYVRKKFIRRRPIVSPETSNSKYTVISRPNRVSSTTERNEVDINQLSKRRKSLFIRRRPVSSTTRTTEGLELEIEDQNETKDEVEQEEQEDIQETTAEAAISSASIENESLEFWKHFTSAAEQTTNQKVSSPPDDIKTTYLTTEEPVTIYPTSLTEPEEESEKEDSRIASNINKPQYVTINRRPESRKAYKVPDSLKNADPVQDRTSTTERTQLPRRWYPVDDSSPEETEEKPETNEARSRISTYRQPRTRYRNYEERLSKERINKETESNTYSYVESSTSSLKSRYQTKRLSTPVEIPVTETLIPAKKFDYAADAFFRKQQSLRTTTPQQQEENTTNLKYRNEENSELQNLIDLDHTTSSSVKPQITRLVTSIVESGTTERQKILIKTKYSSLTSTTRIPVQNMATRTTFPSTTLSPKTSIDSSNRATLDESINEIRPAVEASTLPIESEFIYNGNGRFTTESHESSTIPIESVANADTPRLPTLKELIGYQTYDYTTTPSSVFLNLLPAIDLIEDVDPLSRIENERANINAETLQANDLRKLFYNVNENPLDRELDHIFEIHETDTNDIDAESSISKRRKTRIDHAGSSTTPRRCVGRCVKPTTMRGTPLASLTARSVTRGFYVTKGDVETTMPAYTTPDYLATTTELSLEDETTVPPVDTLDVTESTPTQISTNSMTIASNDTDKQHSEYSNVITEPARTTPLATSRNIVHETTKNEETSFTRHVLPVKPTRRTRGRVRYTDGTTPLSGRSVRGRTRSTTKSYYNNVDVSSTSQNDIASEEESTTTRYNELRSSTNPMTDTMVASTSNVKSKTTPFDYTLETKYDTTITKTSTSMTTDWEEETIRPDSSTTTVQSTQEIEDETDVNEIYFDENDVNEIYFDENDEYESTVTFDRTTKSEIAHTKHELTTPNFETTPGTESTEKTTVKTTMTIENDVTNDVTTEENYTLDEITTTTLEVVRNESEIAHTKYQLTIPNFETTPGTESTDEATVKTTMTIENDVTNDVTTEENYTLDEITTTTPEVVTNVKETTTFSESTQFPSTSSPNPSSSANPITTPKIKEEPVPRQQQTSNYQFGQRIRGNGSRRVVKRKRIKNRTSTEEKPKDSKPNGRHRVAVYRKRQRRPSVASSTTEAYNLVSIDDTKVDIADVQTRRSKLVIKRLKVNENEYDEETIPTEENSLQDTTQPTLVTEEYTERPVNEGTLSQNSGSSSSRTKPGSSILINRLRKVNGSSQSSSLVTRPSTVLGDNRKSRPSETNTVSPTTTIVDAFEDATVSSPEQSVKDEDERAEISDQNGRAQELAVTLADPPISQSSSNTGRLPIRDTLRRRISTTVAPRTDSPRTSSTNSLRFSTVSRNRQRPTSTTRKEGTTRSSTSRPRRPTIRDYDYYEDEETPIVEKSMYNGKLFLTSKGTIKCLDQGNFPHPYSCKKFITCARFVNGLLIGAEYTCPDKLSFDPVGGICNWSAGLGCKE